VAQSPSRTNLLSRSIHTAGLGARRLALGGLLALLAALGVVGCAQEENVILLEVISPEDVGDLTITVVPLDGLAAPDSTTRPVNQTAAEIRETPIRVAIRLGGPREVMVVLSAEGTSAPRLVAQRCFAVAGVARDSVWLVPLGPTEDADGDGYPRRAIATCARPAEGGASSVPCASDDPVLCGGMGEIDCDDDNGSRRPGAPEMCDNGIDEDCDGEDEPCQDGDGDGFSSCRMSVCDNLDETECTADDRCLWDAENMRCDADCAGRTSQSECDAEPRCEWRDGFCGMGRPCDCNDGDPMAYPGAEDPCDDGADQDCDGQNDRCDEDCDGYPAAAPDPAYVDCDDTSATVHPNQPLRGFYGLADGDRLARGCDAQPMTSAASDMCTPGPGGEPMGDGVDQDCNGFVDDGPGCTDTTDRDRDGARACTAGMTTGCDPDDCDPGIAPTREEICGNAFDEDGDGMAQPCDARDADMDGHVPLAMGGDDCDDADPEIYFGAPENCLTTTVSESCTENIPCTEFGGDSDGDGYLTGLPAGARGDCDDGDAEIRPFAAEDPCDGVDNNCDGVVDEVLRAPDTTPGAPDGCVRTGGGATEVDYHETLGYSEYCGGCGVVTEANENCCAGSPTSVDTPSSCGDCGYDCGAHTACPMTGTGASGNTYTCACAPDAAGNWDDCDGSLTAGSGGNGCESDLDTDEAHCGACGNRCGPNQTCNGGSCECVAPFLDCDGLQATGCEINGSNDVNNCRTCGNRCMFSSGNAACIAGECRLASCDPGFDDCNRNPGDGCETPLSTLMNCGRCGETCAGTVNSVEVCSAALRCDYSACDAGFLSCNMNRLDGCETAFSTTNCGACGTVCGTNESCSGTGDCQCGSGPSAATGEACTGTTPDCCGNACVNLQDDEANCGACGNRCGTGELCTAGRCGCGTTRAGIGMGEACVGASPDCCGTSCVNVASNTTNCGACGNVCGANETCSMGQCGCGAMRGTTGMGEACTGAGNECCGSVCTDVRSSATSCGACGTNCASTVLNAVEICSASLCGYSSCDAGFADCVGGMPNGCETSLSLLPNCGACGNSCATILNAVETCVGMACNYSACDTGFLDCNGNRLDGCETNGRMLGNCGSCGNTCAGVLNAVEICTMTGTCNYSACDPGFLDCTGTRTNGCETAFSTTNCGACGNACGAGESCNAVGDCQCGSGPTAGTGEACSGATPDCCGSACVDLQTDESNCGGCGVSCGAGETCSAGRCTCAGAMGSVGGGEVCTGGTPECCSTGCVNPASSTSNCGACGNVCGAGETCSAGACTCGGTSGTMGVGEACTGAGNECCSSTCTNVTTDPTHCGSCTNVCGASETCGGGRCQCGGTTGAAGAQACPGASNECCGTTCANITSSAANCGMCGNDCADDVVNATETCMSSICGYSSCDMGWADCTGGAADGCETDITMPSNCGACGNVCGTNETCNMAGDCACGTSISSPTGPACTTGTCNPSAMGGMGQCV
jgi:hypothetical protein